MRLLKLLSLAVFMSSSVFSQFFLYFILKVCLVSLQNQTLLYVPPILAPAFNHFVYFKLNVSWRKWCFFVKHKLLISMILKGDQLFLGLDGFFIFFKCSPLNSWSEVLLLFHPKLLFAVWPQIFELVFKDTGTLSLVPVCSDFGPWTSGPGRSLELPISEFNHVWVKYSF